jgi:diacylglycerol kinase family enzyme
METRAMMVLNRAAATGRGEDEVKALTNAFDRSFDYARRSVAVVETHEMARAVTGAFRSTCAGHGVVIAGGGAGTLRAVVEGLNTTEGLPEPDHICVAPLRLGSGNVLAKTFGVSGDPMEALREASVNVQSGVVDPCAVMRCVVDGTVRLSMTLVGLGQFGRIPSDLAAWHQAYPRTRRLLSHVVGVERLTQIEYRAGMGIRALRSWVNPDLMESVEVQTDRETTQMRLAAGAIANFAIKGLPLKPSHSAGDPLLSGFLLEGPMSPFRLLRKKRLAESAHPFNVRSDSSVVLRLKSRGPVPFFLDEDPMSFKREVCIDIAGPIGIVPGAASTDVPRSAVTPEKYVREVSS